MTARLARLAVAILQRLGISLCPLADVRPVPSVVIPPTTGGTAWLPLCTLGLPGHYNPNTGGEP